MAKDIAALSGADLAAFKAAMNSYGYVPILSVKADAPVEYVDVSIPSGFDTFYMTVNCAASDGDSPSFAFSNDGGTTFLNDEDGFDTYQMAGYGQQVIDDDTPGSSFNLGGSDGIGGSNALAWLFGGFNSGFAQLVIVPGSASQLPFVMEDSSGFDGTSLFRIGTLSALNPLATIPPTPARINLIRFMPFGNGDSNPPTSGETLTGTFNLFGMPSAD